MVIIAKSETKESLLEHTENALKVFKSIKKHTLKFLKYVEFRTSGSISSTLFFFMILGKLHQDVKNLCMEK